MRALWDHGIQNSQTATAPAHQDKPEREGVKGKLQSYAPFLKYKVRDLFSRKA